MTSTDKDLYERFERWWKTQHVPDIATPDHVALTAYKAAHAEARAEIDALRKDAKRYRWLRDNSDTVTRFHLMERRESDEWDEEIDAAMASEVKS